MPDPPPGDSADADTDGDGSEADAAGDAGALLDVPSGASGGAGDDSPRGCQKVDFLFVIDSSGSMLDEQENLLQSVPGFLATIEETLGFDDFNLMVVDAGMTEGTGCDAQLGAGQVRSAAGVDCGLGGARFATEDTADLGQAFACMASRGTGGNSDERTMDAALNAIGPLTIPGGCNEGFMRDDAITVITIITDEEDDPADLVAFPKLDGTCEGADLDPNSAGGPEEWAAKVLASRQNDEDAVVVLSLIGDCDTPDGMCDGIALLPFDPNAPITGAEPAPRIRAFTESFAHGSVGPVCAPDYTPFFLDAVSVIETACEEFKPEG